MDKNLTKAPTITINPIITKNPAQKPNQLILSAASKYAKNATPNQKTTLEAVPAFRLADSCKTNLKTRIPMLNKPNIKANRITAV